MPVPASGPAGAVSGRAMDVDEEVQRFRARTGRLADELDRDIESLRNEGFSEEAKVLETHAALLKDLQFRHRVETLIRRESRTVEQALDRVLGSMMERLEHSGDALMSERAADIRDIIERLQERSGERIAAVVDALRDVDTPILAVPELSPSLVLQAGNMGVVGIIVENGTSLSHAAILAKSFGLPVVKIGSLLNLREVEYREVLLDAVAGRLFIEPTAEQIGAARHAESVECRAPVEAGPARIWINIVDPEQVTRDLLPTVAGVGLYRTEMLFMKARHDFPSEQEQFDVYRKLFERCPDKPVTFRTLDIGSDKQLPYFSLGPQKNPYLGLRAHRIYRFHPEIFITQVRALLRAAVGTTNLRIMYPMVETLDALLFIRELLQQAIQSLESEGRNYQGRFEQGIMIEVPSAVWEIEELLTQVDFASLGTNDLFQYFFAADRNNANAYASYQPEHPAALRMLSTLMQVAEKVGKPLSICGEIASDSRFVPILVGLGFRDLSVDIHAIGRIRGLLSGLDLDGCRLMVQRCLKAETAQEIRDILYAFNPGQPASARGTRGGYVDPICDMVVNPERTKYVVRREEGNVYFCSAQCRDEYLYRYKYEDGVT